MSATCICGHTKFIMANPIMDGIGWWKTWDTVNKIHMVCDNFKCVILYEVININPKDFPMGPDEFHELIKEFILQPKGVMQETDVTNYLQEQRPFGVTAHECRDIKYGISILDMMVNK